MGQQCWLHTSQCLEERQQLQGQQGQQVML